MKQNEEALEVLLILRRRLLNRMASVIVENREALLNGHSEGNNPLGYNSDLAEIKKSLAELDVLISGLVPLTDDEENNGSPTAQKVEVEEPIEMKVPEVATNNNHDFFRLFRKLVANDRIDDASQELSKMLQMPRDRMVTAARYFARAMKADATLPALLKKLCVHIDEWPESESMRTLVKAFGFQAVESQLAMRSLKSHARDAGKTPLGV